MDSGARVVARAAVSRERVTRVAGAALAKEVRTAFAGGRPAIALVVASVDHDLPGLLAVVRDELGPGLIAGCSTGGVTGRGLFHEGNFAAGIVGLGGPGLQAAAAIAEDYANETLAKGRAVGQRLRAELGGATPRVVLVYGDVLTGADLESFARAVEAEVGCPAIGAGSGQPWGVFAQTYQFLGTRVVSGGAVAVALAGEFSAEIAISTGSEPTASTATVTAADGNVLLGLDDRPAIAVYGEFLGIEPLTELSNDINTRVALGLEMAEGPDEQAAAVVRGPFALDLARGGLILGAPVPVGARVVFHTRSVRAAVDGAEQAAQGLARRLAGRSVRAVLGFECGARTVPLLGKAEATREQAAVQAAFAADAAWLGMLAMGELAPYAGRVTYYNFTYPLLALAE